MLHRYNGLLFTLCRHFSRKGVEADDLLQDASVALWRDSERLLSLSAGPQQAAQVWRAKQRRNSGFAVVLAVMMAVAIPTLMPHHSGYGKVYSNRGDIAEAQWVSLTSEILMTV